MNYQDLIQSFARGDKQKKQQGKNAIIYTRVSSKEQEDNLSLDVQLKGCNEFAQRKGFVVREAFGGTWESAKTDERKEFQRMLKFAKDQREKISWIIVYSHERFSRTGENAIWLGKKLREAGISIIAATQPIDTSMPSGVFQQNILFLFSQYDNDLRREKCVAGMAEKLSRGEWLGKAPIGYEYQRTPGAKEQVIVISDKGKFIKKAFELKGYDKLSNTQILAILNKLGFAIRMQKLCKILRNPFYCGHVTSAMIPGQVVKGKHKPIISEELFLLANNIVKGTKRNVSGYQNFKLRKEIPLRNFVNCGDCNKPFTGYVVKKKQKWYYKCNTVGCKNNRPADILNKKFEQLISYYQIDPKFIPPIIDYIEEAYDARISKSIDDTAHIKAQVTEINKKLETVEERHALGLVKDDVHERMMAKYNEELTKLEKEIASSFVNLSNPYKTITEAVKNMANLHVLWDSMDMPGKQRLLKLCFPSGIFYHKEIDDYRTTKINPALALMTSLSERLKKEKADKQDYILDLSASVVRTGIEPVLPE